MARASRSACPSTSLPGSAASDSFQRVHSTSSCAAWREARSPGRRRERREPGGCVPGRVTMSSRELQLIVNADDFGQSDDTVDATVECFEAGAVTSATVMPGMPATERALEFARAHPELGFGVHLTLCADPLFRPLSEPALVPSLVRADGTLLSTREVRLKAMLGRLVPQELEREIEAQVRVVVEAGIPVTHVDSHRHLHKFQPVRRALETVLPRLGIRRVRAVQDVYLSRPWRSPTY